MRRQFTNRWHNSSAPIEGLTFADFAERGPFFHIGREPVAVDILTEIPGVDFDVAWARRIEDVIDATSGLRASVISREDLITAKLAAGRPQDLADVDAIRKAQAAQTPPKEPGNIPEPDC